MATGISVAPRVGRVLGATTAAGAGISALPDTGTHSIGMWLAIASIVIGSAVIVSLITTKILKKVL